MDDSPWCFEGTCKECDRARDGLVDGTSRNERVDDETALLAMRVVTKNTPIRMRLVCEGCGELHVDEGEFATKPHHTHQCAECGLTWRPAVENTVGVRFLWEQSN